MCVCTDASNGKPLTAMGASQATTPDRNLSLPEDINELSDTFKQLLLGVILVSKPILKAKKIVIYVCAADPDGESFSNRYCFNITLFSGMRGRNLAPLDAN